MMLPRYCTFNFVLDTLLTESLTKYAMKFLRQRKIINPKTDNGTEENTSGRCDVFTIPSGACTSINTETRNIRKSNISLKNLQHTKKM